MVVRRHSLAAMAGLLILGLMAGAAPPASAQERPAPAVVAAPAEVSDLRPAFRFTGRLVADRKVEIRARVPGFLEAIRFEEGARVDAGDPLYEVEAAPYEAVVEQVEGEIDAAEADLALAEIERERKRQLVERGTAAQSELDVAAANVGRVEGRLKRLRGELARARLDVAYCRIEAPFDGVVGLTRADVGALVGPETGSLATLTRLDPMTAEFPITSAAYLRHRAARDGAPRDAAADVSLILADGRAYERPGRLDFLDAAVSPGTDTLIARAVFENPDGLLLDGALVTVELVERSPRPVLNVPQQAVQRDQAGAFVMVVDAESRVELRRVEVGETIEGRSVIRSGLAEGEVVVTEGINKIRPGIRVDAALAGDG